MKQNKETLKQFFETGDKPTQQQYADLIDSYIDAKQPEGEANRRFVIDETGEVSIASEQQAPEYTLSPISGTNTVDLLKGGVSVSQIDLTPYLDNTNLAQLVSGTVDANGLATFTRDDNSTFTVDLSSLSGGVNGNFVTIDTNQTITGVKTIGSSLYTEYIQSNDSVNVAKNITSGGRIRTGGNALDFTESGNAGSATIEADIVGSTVHTLQGKSGIIAHLNDIPQLQAGSNITIDATDPLQPIINATAGSGGATDLSYDAATRTVASSTGTDAVIPLADATNAGLQKANFYEEGAFTPVLGGGTYTNGSTTGSSYVRIGNLVHLYLQIQNINGTGSTLDLNIGGMPFPASASGYWISSNMTLFNGSNYANPDKLLVDFNVGSGTLRFRELNGSYIENVNFSNGEVRLNITYRTNIYTS
ncbi:hypothetical protein SAMN05444344_1275 [Tenacibaculum mesophilum]|uniref:Uncharacterized protein n=1 Tax=Tenacibaculum mesophilum TaxID=104268 RepID=A0ABM7CGN7_9FLAO|nr:hypothetical protein [Tenacibaculum mesophilum]AZJ32963.1 hypothetical protein D6200_10520 [Tenacibaculum mesophilum]QFS28213.1 hypothetical protein F9Y86_07345 [Tenacibaculum mesophilum]SHF70236.1 hypothetical protein SAMN05444344_1275 [Tenacibaculum mesophilum]